MPAPEDLRSEHVSSFDVQDQRGRLASHAAPALVLLAGEPATLDAYLGAYVAELDVLLVKGACGTPTSGDLSSMLGPRRTTNRLHSRCAAPTRP